jgi:hypothetical protein
MGQEYVFWTQSRMAHLVTAGALIAVGAGILLGIYWYLYPYAGLRWNQNRFAVMREQRLHRERVRQKGRDTQSDRILPSGSPEGQAEI